MVVLSVIFWGWLWGPLGMFMAVPLTMVIKVLLDHNETFRWIAVAMTRAKVAGREVDLLQPEEEMGTGASTEPPERNA